MEELGEFTAVVGLVYYGLTGKSIMKHFDSPQNVQVERTSASFANRSNHRSLFFHSNRAKSSGAR